MAADLHLHTTASDGCLKPSQIVEIAYSKGLKAIAITDHDTFDGLEEAISFAKKYPMEIIPAVELSSDVDGQDMHIIAYWPDYKADWLNKILKTFRKGRIQRAHLMVEKLRENGLDVSFKEIEDIAKKAALGRYHIARVLLNKGYVKTMQEAFDRYIGQDACCYVEKPSKSPKEVLEIIKKAGGVAVLAHPGVVSTELMISEYSSEGLVGLEVYHPDHSKTQIKYFEGLAQQYGLIATGGSDFHAKSSTRGAVIGSCAVSMNVVNRLRELAIRPKGIK